MLHSGLHCNISTDRVTCRKISSRNLFYFKIAASRVLSVHIYFRKARSRDPSSNAAWRSITRRESSKNGNSALLVRVRACGRASVVCGHHVSSYPRHAGSPGEKGELGPTGPPGLPGEKGTRGKQGKRVSFSEVLRPPPTIDQSNPV